MYAMYIYTYHNPELERCPAATVDSTQSEVKDGISMNENAAYGKGIILSRSSESEAIAQQQTSTIDDDHHSTVEVVQTYDN